MRPSSRGQAGKKVNKRGAAIVHRELTWSAIFVNVATNRWAARSVLSFGKLQADRRLHFTGGRLIMPFCTKQSKLEEVRLRQKKRHGSRSTWGCAERKVVQVTCSEWGKLQTPALSLAGPLQETVPGRWGSQILGEGGAAACPGGSRSGSFHHTRTALPGLPRWPPCSQMPALEALDHLNKYNRKCLQMYAICGFRHLDVTQPDWAFVSSSPKCPCKHGLMAACTASVYLIEDECLYSLSPSHNQ